MNNRPAAAFFLKKRKANLAALIAVFHGVYKNVYNYLVEIKHISVKALAAPRYLRRIKLYSRIFRHHIYNGVYLFRLVL